MSLSGCDGQPLEQGVGDSPQYLLDWSDALPEGAVISSVLAWSSPPGPTITAVAEDDTTIRLTISKGQKQLYEIFHQATDDYGQAQTRSFPLRIV